MDSPTRRVELCLRPFVPPEVQHRQQEVIDRLNHLAARRALDVVVVWWTPRVCPPRSDDPLATDCPPVVEELLDLADRERLSLAPPDEDDPGSPSGGDDGHALPVVCLVVRDGDGISGVYPTSIGDGTYTVEDGLRMLEEEAEPPNLA